MQDLSENKTGYAVYDRERGMDLYEFKCPSCLHRWFEREDSNEWPLFCPMCGEPLPGSGMDE